jgi:hydrogenase maturation protease
LSTNSGKCRIIGCGNPERGDDAAGVLVARRLRELGSDALEHSGEGLALMESWLGCDSVILIDAVITGAAPGAITVWDGNLSRITGETRGCTTHAFGVAEAVELARVLDRLPRRLLIYGIESRKFELGSAPSPEVAQAVKRLVQQLVQQ